MAGCVSTRLLQEADFRCLIPVGQGQLSAKPGNVIGTGTSSPSCLHDYSFDTITIDKSFANNLCRTRKCWPWPMQK